MRFEWTKKGVTVKYPVSDQYGSGAMSVFKSVSGQATSNSC